MASLTVLYPAAGTHFDRDYYTATHAKLVESTWSKAGLTGMTIVFGSGVLGGGAAPFHCIAVLKFDSEGALNAAVASPEAAPVFADIANFTDAVPIAMIGS